MAVRINVGRSLNKLRDLYDTAVGIVKRYVHAKGINLGHSEFLTVSKTQHGLEAVLSMFEHLGTEMQPEDVGKKTGAFHRVVWYMHRHIDQHMRRMLATDDEVRAASLLDLQDYDKAMPKLIKAALEAK